MHLTRRTLLTGAVAAFVTALAGPAQAGAGSTFHRIYDDPVLRKRFFPFLVNVFNLVPEDALDALIAASVAAHPDDDSIYAAILEGLPAITPFGAVFRYQIPALRVQKEVLGSQTAQLLSGVERIDGYVEMGTIGTYIEPLRQRIPIDGRVVLVTDLPQTFHPAEIVQRGTVRPNADYVPLGNYDPVPREAVADASMDVVSSYIGFHHAPLDRLEGFVESLARVLRPGGRLIVREHDVTDTTQHDVVALAHDVFNAGTAVSLPDNQAQLRHFRSVEAWTAFFDGLGLRREEGHALQEGDPTDNALIALVKA